MLGAFAESADKIPLGVARAPNLLPPTPSGLADHLLHALMAQIEDRGDLAQGASGQVHAAHDVLIVLPGYFRLALCIRNAGPGVVCLSQ
jgi:hypothetical protein